MNIYPIYFPIILTNIYSLNLNNFFIINLYLSLQLLYMDLLRQYVGGPKNRYKDEKFNLDLTYISPRMIAMAFPASGV